MEGTGEESRGGSAEHVPDAGKSAEDLHGRLGSAKETMSIEPDLRAGVVID